MKPLRRVVTGLDAQGRSCVLFDDNAKMRIWATEGAVADNSGSADAGGEGFSFPKTGAQFIFAEFPPGAVSPMHATDTIDYIVVLEGEATVVLETGETRLRAGDVFVDRGVLHAWRNDTDQPYRLVSVLCPAHPVGAGATMTGDVGELEG